MAGKIVPINHDEHKDLRIKDGIDYSIIANDNLVPLIVFEFPLCSSEFPIIFVKNSQTGQFQPAALMGFKPGENYFVDGNSFKGLFTPGLVATYPFRLIPNSQNQEQLFLAVDMDCPLLGTEEGNRLFNDDKSETELFQKHKEDVSRYYEFNQVTQSFCALMAELDLLAPRDLNLDMNGEKITIQSVYVLNDEKFNQLSDEEFLNLRKRGYLPAIYAHRDSLNQVRRLAKMKLDAS